MKYLLLFGIVQSLLLLGQAGEKRMHGVAGYTFVENKRQWPNSVKYAADIPGGRLYLHNRSLTYSFYEPVQDKTSHETSIQSHVHGQSSPLVKTCKYSIHFLNAIPTSQLQAGHCLPTKYNYIKGADPQEWSIGARTYGKVAYTNLYPHIDMELKEQEGALKYEFVLKKGADVENIKLEYVGTKGLSLRKGRLWVKTDFGAVIEQRPYCYQIIKGNKKEIKSRYILKKNVLSFALLEAYDPEFDLVIDPEIVFSTYSGSTFDNWGNTATYDKDGNLYSGGIVFGHKFPDSDSSASEIGDIDIAIYKYNAKGTRAEYITYLGGDLPEVPHSLLVNGGELIILGITGSANAPTSPTAFDRDFNGGRDVTPLSGIHFKRGADLYLAKLDAAGNMVNATYVGGSANDGVNSFLAANYGDVFRGDIAVDGLGNICIGSNTSSVDFPKINGLATGYNGGGSDGLICQFSNDLSTIRWSTMVGGGSADAIYSIKTAKNGEIFVAGGTKSADLPTTATALHSTALGGEDGFVMRMATDGSAILASTYLGTDSSDQAYFVQLDSDEDVYVLGQTKGTYPIKDATYRIPNSGQFIQKLDRALSTNMLSTVFGSGAGSPDISPTAFLVNDCDKIYVTGWGGSVNRNYMKGSTQNLPVTPDAFQSTTDGSDFYLCVFEKDMESLVYATFLGGNKNRSSAYQYSHGEHVDGGTSRFDPKGIVYHAVCSCGEINYPTYPNNVWSTKNKSPLERFFNATIESYIYLRACNNAAFKFDLFEVNADVEADDTLGCSPFKVNYRNHSKGGITYEWYVDGKPIQTTTDTSVGLTHTYTKAGIHKLMLVASNKATCKINDTDYVNIVVDTVLTKITPPFPICKGKDRAMLAKIDSSATSKFVWHPGRYLSDSTIANPRAFPPQTTTFKVVGTNDNGCSKLDSVVLVVHPLPRVRAGRDTSICYGHKVWLNASGAQSYYWTPTDSVANPYREQTSGEPYASTEFYVEGTDTNGCKAMDTIKVKVTYLSVMLDDTIVCKGGSVVLVPQTPAAVKYLWKPSTYLSQSNIAKPTSTPLSNITYTLSIEDAQGCKSSGRDTLAVRLRDVIIKMVHDTVLCRNLSTSIEVSGALSYRWNRTAPELVCKQPDCGHVAIMPADSIRWFVVNATDKYGCKEKDSLRTLFRPVIKPIVEFEYSAPRCVGVLGTFKGRVMAFDSVCYVPKWLWDFGDQVIDTTERPTHTYKKEGVYPVSLTLNGSKPFVKTLNVLSEDSCLKNIYIPNAFTPNGDGVNDLLYVRGINIVKVQFHLYNNLGERVFYTDNLHTGWDGVYKGEKQTSQVYVYHCDATFWDGSNVSKEGNVTLLE